MERPPLLNDRPQGIDPVSYGRHLLLMPVEQPPGPLAADVEVLGGNVVLFVRVGGQVEEHFAWKEMKTVVESAHVQPAVEAHRALADVAALADDHLLAPA